MIRTVLQDIPSTDGFVLAHEHLVIDLGSQKSADVVLGEQEEPFVIEDLRAAKRESLGLLADLSVPGSGRDVKALARISRETGVPVIAATGFYWDPFPPAVMELSRPQLAETMIAEIESGADGTAHRCGVIKIGMPKGTPDETGEHLFRAAVDAALATGAAIVSHTSAVSQAPWQIDLLKSCGLPPERALVSHFCKAGLDEVLQALKAGVFIGIDQIGFASGPGYAHLAGLVSALCRRGYERQIILSSDMARRSRLGRFGGASYGTVFTEFLPHLREEGVSERQIEAMLKDNPERLFRLQR